MPNTLILCLVLECLVHFALVQMVNIYVHFLYICMLGKLYQQNYILSGAVGAVPFLMPQEKAS